MFQISSFEEVVDVHPDSQLGHLPFHPLAGSLLTDDAFHRISYLMRQPPRTDLAAEAHRRVDWKWVRHNIREKARRALSDDQLLGLASMMAEWVKLASDLVDAAVAAESAASDAITATGALRQAQLALAGNVIWAVLTTAAPPPFGAIAGAVVRGLLTQERWDQCFSVAAEWTLQAPWPHTGKQADALGEWRPWVPGKNTNSPQLNYIGGHPTLRELKDYHKLLETVRDPMNPGLRDWFDAINDYTLSAALKLPPPPKQTRNFRDTIHQELTAKLDCIRTAVRQVLFQYGSSPEGTERLMGAIYHWLYEDRHPSRPPPSPQLAPREARMGDAEATRRAHRVIQIADLYINKLADFIVADLVRPLRGQRVPQLDVQAAQEELERVFMARYLVQNLNPAGGQGRAAGAEDFWVQADGSVKSELLMGPLERKLQQLGIVRKYEGAHLFGSFGRSDAYQTAVRAWHPPFADGDFIAVPYQSGGENARGRLAAWARSYSARTPRVLVDTILRRCV